MPYSGTHRYLWRVMTLDGVTVIAEDRYPESELSEAGVVALLEKMSGKKAVPINGKRRTFVSGENPRHTASL